MGTKDWFYRVEFKEPPIEGDELTEFYFFKPSQPSTSSSARNRSGARSPGCGTSEYRTACPYRGRKCTITKEQIRRKKQN